MLRASPLGRVAEYGDDAHLRVVALERLDAAGHVDVGGRGIEEQLAGRSMGEELLEASGLGTGGLDAGKVEEVGFLAVGEADPRMAGQGGRQRGGAGSLDPDDGGTDHERRRFHPLSIAPGAPVALPPPAGDNAVFQRLGMSLLGDAGGSRRVQRFCDGIAPRTFRPAVARAMDLVPPPEDRHGERLATCAGGARG